MKSYTIIEIMPLTNTLVLLDPDNGSKQYYKLHSQDRALNYKVGATLEI